jgi:hypothetical protein
MQRYMPFFHHFCKLLCSHNLSLHPHHKPISIIARRRKRKSNVWEASSPTYNTPRKTSAKPPLKAKTEPNQNFLALWRGGEGRGGEGKGGFG